MCPEGRKKEAEILYNGINNSAFFYDENLRQTMREKLQLDGRFVVCNIARINRNKNQVFLVDVFKEIINHVPSAKLLLVGPYIEDDYNVLMQKIEKEKLKTSVMIMGEKNQVNAYLNAADYFVLPSIFEGLSLASIEAQSTGIRCLLSTGTPPEAKVTELARRVDLTEGAKAWANIILDDIEKEFVRRPLTLNAENTIEGMAEHLSVIYNELLGD